MALEAGDSIYATFTAAAARWPDRPFLHAPADAIGAVEPFDRDFEDAAGDVEALRRRYAALGYGFGHRIGLALDNHPLFFLHFLALNALGASVAPINSAMRAEELAGILTMADLDLIVSWPRHFGAFGSAQGISLHFVPLSPASLDGCPPASRPVREGKAGADDEAAMLFTSGTTGRPKGCVLSNAYFTWIGDFYANLGGYCAFREGEDRILTPLPVNHMNAIACSFMAAIMTGSCLIQLDRFHASRWWRTVRETQATVIHYLGVMPAILLQRGEDDASGLPVRFGFGAGVDPRHHATFEARFGFPLIEAWAMTETGAAAWITANREPRHVGTRCFGKVPAHLDVKVSDEEGNALPDGEAGELLVRARGGDPRRHFFTAYYKDPDATEEAWSQGWFHTGDIVRRDADGNLYFVDRNKNIVRRSGENIAAVEVEGALMQHRAVKACAVLPVEDELRGEEVMALVQTAGLPGDEALAEDIVTHCLGHLAYFKVPGYVAFVDELPTTASQKLQRGEIRTLGRAIHAEGGAHDLRARKRGPRAAG